MQFSLKLLVKIGYCQFSTVSLSGLEIIQTQCYLLSITWFLLHVLQECSNSVSRSWSVEMLLWKLEPLAITCTSDFLQAFSVVTHLTSICDALGAEDWILLRYLGLWGDWLDGRLTTTRLCRSTEHLQYRLFLSHHALLAFSSGLSKIVLQSKNQSPYVDWASL